MNKKFPGITLIEVATGSNITVAVDTNGTGATWVDVCIVDNYGTAGSDPLTMLIDGTDHNLIA